MTERVSKAVFVPQTLDDGEVLYDLWVDGRCVSYEEHLDQARDALRRARYEEDDVWVEDETGYRTRLPLR